MSINKDQAIDALMKAYAETFTKELLIHGEIGNWVSTGAIATIHPRIAGLHLLFHGRISKASKEMVLDAIKDEFVEMIKRHGMPKSSTDTSSKEST